MFTTAVCGSYPRFPDPPRPRHLEQALSDWHAGILDEKGINRALERATVDAVIEMIAAGMEIVSDGNIRKHEGIYAILSCIDGIELPPNNSSNNGKNTAKPKAIRKVNWHKPIVENEYRFLMERATVDVRPVLIGPFSMAMLCNYDEYPGGVESLTLDLAHVLRRELEGLMGATATIILIEEPLLTAHKEQMILFAQASEILCRNIDLKVMISAPFGDLIGIEDVFKNLPFAGIALDMVEGKDNETLLSNADLWEERIMQLGLIDSRSPGIESVSELVEKILHYSQFHNPDHIWIAPNAGLAGLSRTVAFEKLSALSRAVEIARREVARGEPPGGTIPT